MFINYNLKCICCGLPLDYEEQVFCEDCDYEHYDVFDQEDEDHGEDDT